MFESVTKYGLRLALDPAGAPHARRVVARRPTCAGARSASRSCSACRPPTRASEPPPTLAPHLPDEVQALLDGTRALARDRIALARRGRERRSSIIRGSACASRISSSVTRGGGEPVYVEVLGFWSRDAVWKRVELAQQGLGARIVFCASSRLRVSAEVLADDASAALYVFKGKPSARALLERSSASRGRSALRSSSRV